MIVAFLAGLLVLLSNRPPDRDPSAPVPMTHASVPVVVPFPGAPSPSNEPVPATVVASTALPVTSVETEEASIEGVIAEGLAAWGRFATTGDLVEVEPWFWPDRPQWDNLVADAGAIVARNDDGPAYTVSTSSIEVEAEGDVAEAVVDLRFARAGEQEQRFQWRFTLERRAGEWRIATVVEAG